MTIWEQGPLYPDTGKKIVEFPYSIRPGPSDSMIVIEGFDVQPDANGNFIDNGIYQEDELNAIHTFAVMRMTIDLFDNLLEKTINWSWQQSGRHSPVTVRITNNDINARYLRDQQCIELDYYGPPGSRIYNCRCTDFVVHETAHAILDSLRPAWENGDIETEGAAEAFCDLAAMFWILSQPDLCEKVIIETGGNLEQDNMLSLFGVGHGFEENPMKCVRNAFNQNIYDKNAWSPYDFSTVLTGFLYDLLILLFHEKKVIIGEGTALWEAGRHWMKVIVKAYQYAPPGNVSLTHITSFITRAINSERIRGLLDKRGL